MKDKIKSELKTKYADLGLSDTQIEGIAAILAVSVNSDEGMEKAVAAAEPLLKSMQSENDRQRTAAAQAEKQLKELTEKLKELENRQQPPNPPKGGKGGKDEPEVPEYIKALMEKMNSVTSDIAAIKGEKLTNTRKAEIATLTEGLPESIKAVYYRMDVSKYDEAQYAELKQTVKAETEKIKAEINQRGFNPPFAHQSGDDGNVKKASEKEIKDAMKFMPKMF